MGSLLTYAALEREAVPLHPFAFLAAARRTRTPLYGVLELAITAPGYVGSNGLLLSDTSLASPSMGQYQGKILTWPVLDRSVSTLGSGLMLPEYEVVFDDTDGTWRALVQGPLGASVRGSAATIYLVIPSRPRSEWPVYFAGIIADHGLESATRAVLRLRYDDRWLETEFPKRLISRDEWRSADAGVIGNVYPLLYGTFSSQSLTDDGLVPTYLVDADGPIFRYIPCIAHVLNSNTTGVYKDGRLLTSGYAITFPIVNGIQVTSVDFTVSQGSSSITLDVFGYETAGDGTGQPIDRAAYALAHMLTNFAKGDYASGPWADLASGPLDLEDVYEADRLILGNRVRGSLAAQQMATDGRAVSRYVNAKTTGIKILEEWCDQFHFRPYWKRNGRIGLVPLVNQRRPLVYLKDPHAWVREREEIGASFTQKRDRESLLGRLDVQLVRDESKGHYLSTLVVADASAPQSAIQKVEAPWADARGFQTYYELPNATTQDSGWVVVGAASIAEAVGQPFGNADDFRYVSWRNASANGTFRVAGPNLPGVLKILTLRVRFRARFFSNGGGGHQIQAFVRPTGGGNALSTSFVLTPSFTDFVYEWKANPATSAKWTIDDVNALEWGISTVNVSTDFKEVSQCILEVVCIGEPPASRLVRESMSRRLRLEREELGLVEIEAPIAQTANELGSVVQMSNARAEETRDGWGEKPWQRRFLMKVGEAADLAKMTTREQYLDMRRLSVCLWETDRSTIGSGLTAPGIARLGAWRSPYYPDPELRRFARNGKAHVPHPAQPQQLFLLQSDTEKYTVEGLLIEGARTNLILNSAFVNNFLGWTRAGNGVGGALINLQAQDTIFDPAVSAQAMQLKYGSAAAAGDLTLTQTIAPPAGAVGPVSIIYKNLNGAAWYWRAHNVTTSRDWDDTAGAWGNSGLTIWNALAVTSVGWVRFVSKLLTFGSGENCAISYGLPSAQAIPSQESRLYHAQWEQGLCASSPIVTPFAGPVTTSADSLTYTCILHETAYPLDYGYFWFEFVPDWSSADLGPADQVCLFFVSAAGDPGNYDWGFYDSATASVCFERRANGVTSRSSCAMPFVRGDVYQLGFRWTGEAGELDLPPFSLSVFVNGSKGVDVVTARHVYMRHPYTLQLGGGKGTHQAFGKFRNRVVQRLVPTDGEMGKLPNG